MGELELNDAIQSADDLPRSTHIVGTPEIVIEEIEPHDIFEGTEQIQQLVISRAISGMRIE